jgi:hypothetical protein
MHRPAQWKQSQTLLIYDNARQFRVINNKPYCKIKDQTKTKTANGGKVIKQKTLILQAYIEIISS